jgi:membrane protease YdiL (CAAX protease family)
MNLPESDPVTVREVTREPPGSSVWGLLGTLLWTVLIGGVFLFGQILATAFYIVFTMGQPPPRDKLHDTLVAVQFDGRLVAFCTFVTALICVPLILGIVKLKRGTKLKEYLGLTLPSARQFWGWSLFTVAICLLMDGVLFLLHQPTVTEFMLKTYVSASPRSLLWLALAVGAPVFEETCFRGFIFKGLAASRLRWQGATFITALLWAVIHVQYDWYGIAGIFVLGLLLGTARGITKSTVLTMCMHSLINILAVAETAIALGHL